MEIDRALIVRALVAMNTGLSRAHMQAMFEAIIETDGLYAGVPLERSANGHFIEMMAFVSRLSETELSPGARVLDLGSGQGRLLAALRKAFGIEAHGVDKSAYAPVYGGANSVEVIRALWSAHNKSGLRILSPFDMEAYPLPYTDDYFDIVTFKNAAGYVRGAAEPFLAEVVRVLRPGGTFLIDTPNRAGGGFGPDELRTTLQRAGFEIIKAETTRYTGGDDATPSEDISIITARKP